MGSNSTPAASTGFNRRNLPVSKFFKHADSLVARRRRAAVIDGRELFANDGDEWPSALGERRPLRARSPPLISGGDAAARPQLAGSFEACPLSPSWRSWDMLGREERDCRYLSPADHRVCARARRLLPIAHRGFVDLDWEVAPDDSRREPLTADEVPSKHQLSSPRHTHAETEIDGHRLHVDFLSATHGGPGRSYTEFRIFVDGRLAGRGGSCGCSLGFGGSDLPAVAAVGMNAAITVDHPMGRAPIVELWHAHLLGVGWP